MGQNKKDVHVHMWWKDRGNERQKEQRKNKQKIKKDQMKVPKKKKREQGIQLNEQRKIETIQRGVKWQTRYLTIIVVTIMFLKDNLVSGFRLSQRCYFTQGQ